MLHSIDDFFAKFDTDTANTLLVAARVWTTLATGEIGRKDAAAEWALARLAEEHRPSLARAFLNLSQSVVIVPIDPRCSTSNRI